MSSQRPEGLPSVQSKEGIQRNEANRCVQKMLIIADSWWFHFFALLNVYIIYTYYILIYTVYYTSGMEISHVEMRYNHWNFLNVVFFSKFSINRWDYDPDWLHDLFKTPEIGEGVSVKIRYPETLHGFLCPKFDRNRQSPMLDGLRWNFRWHLKKHNSGFQPGTCLDWHKHHHS